MEIKQFFWHDKWIGNSPLKLSFARIFNLASNQNVTIYNLGSWEDVIWIWRFFWRRNLFEWELQLFAQLLTVINAINLYNHKEDRLIWEPNKKGLFSIKSLYKCLLASSSEMGQLMPFIWLCLAPPKVETLVWLINHGRLCTKSWFLKLGIIPPAQSMCPRCNVSKEIISHIFLFCNTSWLV